MTFSTTPPVVSLIKGGLGNQMFCYAAGRALAIRLNRELQLDVRTGYQRDGYARSYRLDRFPIIAHEASQKLSLGGDTRAWAHKLARARAKWSRSQSRSYIAEKPDVTPTYLSTLKPSPRRPVYLNGYWQDEAFFSDIADALRKELAPPAPFSDTALEARRKILSTRTPVMLHVRRDRYNPRLTSGYYNDSIQQCLSRFPDATFYVFGDDFPWAREQLFFEGATARFMDRVAADEIEDIHLMTCCRHAIVANSSFSWWAAWLAAQPGQHVWTPAQPGYPVKPGGGWLPVPNELEYL